MKKILLLLFVFISTQVFSQFGVKGGVTYTGLNNITNSELSIGLSAGVFVNLESFKPELNFYQQTYASTYATYNTNYLNLSANYELLITDALGLIGGLGWDYWLSSSMKINGTTTTINSGNSGIDNLMWNLNFGVAYYISDAIIMDLRYTKPVANGLLENFRLDSGIYGTVLTVGYLFGY